MEEKGEMRHGRMYSYAYQIGVLGSVDRDVWDVQSRRVCRTDTG